MSDAPAQPRAVRFVGEVTTPVPLADPIEVDGVTMTKIHVAKLTVGAYRRHTDAGGKSDILDLPMFSDQAGAAVPPDVMDALSFRDAQTLTEVATSFLNQPLKAAAPGSASA